MKKYFLVALGCFALLLAFAPSAHAAITFDASSTKQTIKGTTATSSITIGSGSNEILLICISTPGKTVSSVTVGGVAATKAVEKLQSTTETASLWYLTNVSSGAKIVSSTLSASVTSTIGLSSYFGVSQTTPIDATASSSASTGSTASSSITTLTDNDEIVDCLSPASGATLTARAGQTIVSKQVSTAPLEGSSYETVSTPQATSTVWTLASSQAWALSQAALRPAGSAPDGTSITTTTGGDGGRSGDSITVTGTGFGSVTSTANAATCSGGVGTGCVEFIVGGTATIPSSNITSWSDTSIVFTVPAALVSNGGASSVQVWSDNASDTTPLTFYVYPRISAVASLGTNAARTYNAGDTDGLIMLSGDHFGTTTGTSSILGYLATLYGGTGGACTVAGFTSSTACFEVSTSIPTSTYTGNIILNRASDNKQASTTANSFSILPRILAVNPASTSTGNVVQIIGDHLCQSGTCPVSPNRSSTTNNVTFSTGSGAIAFVQVTSTDNFTKNSVSDAVKFGTNPSLNDLLIGVGTWGTGSATTSSFSCSDSAGNTYATTTVKVDAANQQAVGICYAIATHSVSSDTLAVTYGNFAAGSQDWSIADYSGVATSNPLDASSIATSTGCSGTNCVTSGASATSQGGDLIFGYVLNDDGGGGTITQGTNFTNRLTPNGGTGIEMLEDMTQASAGSVSSTFTFTNTNHAYVADMAAFKAATSGNLAHDSDFVNQTGGSGACNGGSAAWVDGEICVKVPSAASVGSTPIYVTSNGNLSNIFAFTVSATAAPGAPGTPTYASISSSTLTVSWSASTGGATSYILQRATSSQVYAQATTTTATSYGDSGLSANTTYYYEAAGVNAGGTGSYSATSSVLTLPNVPGTPTFTSVSTSTLTVNWSAPTGGAAYYKIERAPDSSGSPGTFTQITTTTATSYADSGLSALTTYWYRIRSSNATGDSGYSGNASTTTTTAPNAPPNAPSQDSPANNSQDLTTLPVFEMTATDPESNNLQYKVIIYSNSGCTAVVQTDDESASQTGWSGQNASSSHEYTSGTQGTFTTQSALSANTKYYWTANAKDPEGSNTWTVSGSCNNFTTSDGLWTTDSGAWSISGNKLVVMPGAGSSVQIHATGVSQTNGVIEFEVESSAVGSNTGNVAAIVRENSGAANWYDLAIADFQNQQGAIGKTISGAYSSLATGAYTFSGSTLYDLRGSISGTTLSSWINGGDALTTTDSSLSSAGNIGIAASSTNGSATFTIDDFAFYTSNLITMNNLPVGGSWSVLNHSGTVIACQTGSTWDLSTYSGQVPIDYDNGGGSIAVWASSNSCSPSGSPDETYPSSGFATDIFGGDAYSYAPAASSTASTGGVIVATSSINISPAGAVTD